MNNKKYKCQKDFIIIVPVGDKSLHENWINSDIYDLFVIYYDKNNSWPETEKKYLEKTNVDYVIQINGKKRSLINAEKDLKQELLFELVKKDKLLDKYLTDISIKKIIFVKNRLMNILI